MARSGATSEDIEIIPRFQLTTLRGRPCEACGESMPSHAWAALDRQGFVVYCVNKPKEG